ncbi:hypothetical protein [Streptomyces sp. HPF1205]|uniref:hypothetical protein n=1 Tax=Streptomyces sp. HPF1205 TaxID=2873262 RepID=UPI001CEDF02C|nr:hypothetical protein [Streptomyces sp. HPF1205]
MWPGDQHGGQQNPQGTPPQPPQGPYGQPNPYAQPGYPQQQPPPPPQPTPGYPPAQPYGGQNPYAQPPAGYQQPPAGGYPAAPPVGPPTPQQWGPPVPGGPEGSGPPGGRRNLTIGIAIASAVAVIAAVVVGAVVLTGNKKDEAAKSPSPATPASRTPSPTPTTAAPTDSAVTAGSGDSPRGAPGALDVKPVVPGWKVVRRTERNVAFDVPPDWTVGDEGEEIGFADKTGNPAVAMGAPAFYKHDWCKSGDGTADRAAAGTKGANGAKSVRNAAEVQATQWAYWAYQENGKGTFSKVMGSKAFHNAYGISGWQAEATATHVPRTNKCVSDGAAYTVAWIDPTQSDPTMRLVVWVLYCDRGVSDQVSQATIDKIKSTIRLIKK